MFNPHLEPQHLTDEQLESKIKDVTLRINQASRMNNGNMYQQLLAINNTLQMESQSRQAKASLKQDDDDSDDDFNSLINVKR
tara:strand:+ start:289 stop:534 length:246 start_codon:yes stop_codon:yes gene_type:complete